MRLLEVLNFRGNKLKIIKEGYASNKPTERHGICNNCETEVGCSNEECDVFIDEDEEYGFYYIECPKCNEIIIMKDSDEEEEEEEENYGCFLTLIPLGIGLFSWLYLT